MRNFSCKALLLIVSGFLGQLGLAFPSDGETYEELYHYLAADLDAAESFDLVAGEDFVTTSRVQIEWANLVCDFGFDIGQVAKGNALIYTSYRCFLADEERCELKVDLKAVDSLTDIVLPKPSDCGRLQGFGAVGVGSLAVPPGLGQSVDLKRYFETIRGEYPRMIDLELQYRYQP